MSSVVTLEHFRDRRAEAREVCQHGDGDAYCLVLPLCQGRVQLTCDGKSLHEGLVFPGMARVVSPGETVRGVVFTPSELVLLNIPGPRFRSTIEALGRPHRRGISAFIDPLTCPQPQLERLARVLVGIRDLDPAHEQLCIDGVADAILAYILQHHGRGPSGPRGGLSPSELRRAVEFADAEIDGHLDLASWAASLGLAAAEFTRRFRLATGFAPYAWFMRHRIDRAKQMMADPNQRLDSIALRVGFSSQSHFTEAFRRLTGTSPARWRSDRPGGEIR